MAQNFFSFSSHSWRGGLPRIQLIFLMLPCGGNGEGGGMGEEGAILHSKWRRRRENQSFFLVVEHLLLLSAQALPWERGQPEDGKLEWSTVSYCTSVVFQWGQRKHIIDHYTTCSCTTCNTCFEIPFNKQHFISLHVMVYHQQATLYFLTCYGIPSIRNIYFRTSTCAVHVICNI